MTHGPARVELFGAARQRVSRTVRFSAALAPMVVAPLVATSATATGHPSVDPAAPGAADEPAAIDLLHRAVDAWAQVTYTGTQYVAAQGPATTLGAVVEVHHRAGGRTKVRLPGGGQYEVDSGPVARWLAGSGGPVDLLVRGYDVSLTGTASVAGRPAQVVEARRDDASVAARVWLDAETGLALRREVYDRSGSTVRAGAFVEIQVRPATGDPARTASAGVPARSLGSVDLAALRRAGFACPAALGRNLVLYEARLVESGATGPVLKLGYSDGIATVSVFEQAGRLDPDELEGFAARRVGRGTVYSSDGLPARLTWSTGERGQRVVTVVADDPVATVPAVLTALPPRDMDEDGLLDRVGRGMTRLSSWLNPFG